MKKRGELTSTQIGMLVIAIMGFLVVLFFILGFDFGGVSEREVCHLSVLTRGTSPEAAQMYIPLKCTTEKICLDDGTGNGCKSSFAGESINKISLDKKDNAVAAQQIDKTSAEAMYGCWQMMGEGKIDLFHSLSQNIALDYAKPVCVICSRIAVDVKDARRLNSIYSLTDLGAYLQNNIAGTDGTKSYLEYFTDGQVSSYAKVENRIVIDNPVIVHGEGFCNETNDTTCDSSAYIPITVSDKDKESAVVFMQIKPKSYGDVLKSWGGIAVGGAGGAFAISPKWTMKGITYSTKFIKNFPILSLIATGVVVGNVVSNVYDGRKVAAGYCGEVTLPGVGSSKIDKDRAKNGCSIVQVVPYDAEAINKLCTSIESSP
ncbi:MAG: hypothetical protein AABX66_00545 [Nanoarchaeota archaeon]